MVSICLLVAGSALAQAGKITVPDGWDTMTFTDNGKTLTLSVDGNTGSNSGFAITAPNYALDEYPLLEGYEFVGWELSIKTDISVVLGAWISNKPGSTNYNVTGNTVTLTYGAGGDTAEVNPITATTGFGAFQGTGVLANQPQFNDYTAANNPLRNFWLTEWQVLEGVELQFSGDNMTEEFVISLIATSHATNFAGSSLGAGARFFAELGDVEYTLRAVYYNKDANMTPEPATILMLLAGAGALPFARRFRKS